MFLLSLSSKLNDVWPGKQTSIFKFLLHKRVTIVVLVCLVGLKKKKLSVRRRQNGQNSTLLETFKYSDISLVQGENANWC